MMRFDYLEVTIDLLHVCIKRFDGGGLIEVHIHNEAYGNESMFAITDLHIVGINRFSFLEMDAIIICNKYK